MKIEAGDLLIEIERYGDTLYVVIKRAGCGEIHRSEPHWGPDAEMSCLAYAARYLDLETARLHYKREWELSRAT